MKDEPKQNTQKNSRLDSLIKNDFLRYSSKEDFKPNPYPNQTRRSTITKLETTSNNCCPTDNQDKFSALIAYFHPDRTRSQRERLFISFLSNLFYALANLTIKSISKYYPNADATTTSLYRFVVMFLLSYLYIINRNITFLELGQVKSKFTLAIRIFSAYLISVSLANSVHYLRLGTAISFFFVSPIFTSLASIYFFKDKCKTQNVIGLTVCMVAMLMITNSESQADQENTNFDLGLGFIWGTSSLVGTVAMIISTKMLVYEIDSINLNYFIGKFSTVIGVGICIINGSLFYLYPGFVFLTSLNGFFFWCALYFMNISLKINNLIAVSCIGFLSLVYAFGFGFIFFGEMLRFVDVLASLIIFGFNIYSIMYPAPQENSNANNSSNSIVDSGRDRGDMERKEIDLFKNST